MKKLLISYYFSGTNKLGYMTLIINETVSLSDIEEEIVIRQDDRKLTVDNLIILSVSTLPNEIDI